MSTKINPGLWDCFRAALPDEPMFILLARDSTAPDKVRQWADDRRKKLVRERLQFGDLVPHDADARYREDMAKCRDADFIADDMESWRAENDGIWRKPAERRPFADIAPALRDAVADTTKRVVCSSCVAGDGEISLTSHRVRAWTVPGFNCRMHFMVFESVSDKFAKLAIGEAEINFTDWHVTGFEALLGDATWEADSNRLSLQIQTVGD